MSRISELFGRQLIEYTDDGDCICRPYTEEELDEIIKYLRERRAKREADNAARIARGLPPLKTIGTLTVSQAEERERRAAVKAAEREAKAASKAAKAAERKRSKVDPRQLDFEEAMAASAGDAGCASTLKQTEHSD